MTAQNQSKRPRNWTRIILIVSLSLNLLVVGVVAGAFMRHDAKSGRQMDRMTMGLGLYIGALPDDAKKDLSVLVGIDVKDRRSFRRMMRERHEILETALQQEPFSADAVRAAMSENRAFSVQRTQSLQDAFVDALASMSEAERAVYFADVKALKASRKKHKRDHKNKD